MRAYSGDCIELVKITEVRRGTRVSAAGHAHMRTLRQFCDYDDGSDEACDTINSSTGDIYW